MKPEKMKMRFAIKPWKCVAVLHERFQSAQTMLEIIKLEVRQITETVS